MKKKLFAIALAVLLPLGLLAGSGDVNGDGKINVADIVELVNHLRGNTSDKFILDEADVNNDGMVDEADVAALAEKTLLGGKYIRLLKKEYHMVNSLWRHVPIEYEANIYGEELGDFEYEVITAGCDWLHVTKNDIEYDINNTGKKREALVVVKNVKNHFYDTIKIVSHSVGVKNSSHFWYVLTCQPSGDIIEIPIEGDLDGLPVTLYDEYEDHLPAYMERLSDEVRNGILYIRLKIAPNTEDKERYYPFYFKIGDGDREWMQFVQPGCNAPSFAEQKEALEILYKETNGDNWYNHNNWLSEKPINEWYGVNNDVWDEFQVIGNYVLRLRLNDNNLIGKIPAEMRLLMPSCKPFDWHGLDYSWHFTMEDNYLFGKIPESVKNHSSWNELGWEIVPQKNWCQYSGQFDWNGFNLKTKDGEFTYLLEDKTSTVQDILQQNEYTIVFNAGIKCDDPMFWADVSSRRINLYLDYCHKGLGMVAIAGVIEDHPWDDAIDYVKTKLEEGMPSDIHWIRNGYGRSAFGSIIPTQVGNTYLLDKEGNLIQIWCATTCAVGHVDWCLDPISDYLKEHIGEPEGHEPFTFNYYTSTDFSQDGSVMTLQAATTGKGIDLVFLGEAYVDSDMEPGGLYEKTMYEAMEQFFTEEPYKSMRDRFNVYAVKAVSPNAVYDSGTKLAIGGDIEKAFEYAKKAVGDRDDRLMVGVICKPGAISERSCTFMFEGDGSFAAWMFEGVTPVLNHEMGGHGVAFLLDEYVECGMEDLSPNDEAKAALDASYATYGEGANVDWRSNPAEVKWAHFINDYRYADECIGVYEGSCLYGHGAYRPTQNSMMRYNDCGFNAPSREAIYKRVMKLSEDDTWTYDYETFVTFDEPIREAYRAARSRSRTRGTDDQESRIESRPPTIYKGTWRDAGKCEKVEYTSRPAGASFKR